MDRKHHQRVQRLLVMALQSEEIDELEFYHHWKINDSRYYGEWHSLGDIAKGVMEYLENQEKQDLGGEDELLTKVH